MSMPVQTSRSEIRTTERTTMRAYEESHPWINFQLDLGKVDYRTWRLLGAAQAKCEHISGVPLMPAVAAELHEVFLAKGAMATTAIEGNTLTEHDIRKLMADDLDLPPSKEYLAQEVMNVLEACNEVMVDMLSGRDMDLRVEDIKNYNRIILENLPLDEAVIPGKFRHHETLIIGSGYRGAPPEDLEYLVGRLCDWLNYSFEVDNDLKIAIGILKAILAHVYIAWIHPFADGNGRTARLIELKLMLDVGIPTPAAHLLSNHYNQTRSEYYRHLAIASKKEDGIFDFVKYALQGFIDTLDEQIQRIESQQLMVHWVNYIHEMFRNQDGKREVRRRRLMLDLVGQPEPVPLTALRHISPRIAEAYASLTDRTLKRDVDALEEMGVLEKKRQGVRARIELMIAFLPPKRSPNG